MPREDTEGCPRKALPLSACAVMLPLSTCAVMLSCVPAGLTSHPWPTPCRARSQWPVRSVCPSRQTRVQWWVRAPRRPSLREECLAAASLDFDLTNFSTTTLHFFPSFCSPPSSCLAASEHVVRLLSCSRLGIMRCCQHRWRSARCTHQRLVTARRPC